MPEKKWVFDTVALSNFLLSDSIFILEERYCKHGIITSEVYNEISVGIAEYQGLKHIETLIDQRIFKLVSLSRSEHRIFLGLIRHLGKGEASCIAVAKEQSAIVVTDDRSARKQCQQMRIPFTGTVGILKASVLDGHIDMARREYRTAIALKRTCTEAHVGLGYLSFIQGQWELSLEHYVKAIEIDPTNADAHYGIGRVILETRGQDEAVPELKKTLDLDPTYDDARETLTALGYLE